MADGFEMAARVAVARLDEIAETFAVSDTENLVQTAMTTLGSKMYVCSLSPQKKTFKVFLSIQLHFCKINEFQPFVLLLLPHF